MYQINQEEIEDGFRDSYGDIHHKTVNRINKTGKAHLKQYLSNNDAIDFINYLNVRLSISIDLQKPFAYRTHTGYDSGHEFFYNMGFGVLRIFFYASNGGHDPVAFDSFIYPYHIRSRGGRPLLIGSKWNTPTYADVVEVAKDMLIEQVKFMNRAQQVADTSLHIFTHRSP